MLCQEGILDQHSWFGQTLEQPRWSYCLFENLVEVILMNYESWDFKQVPCQVSISLCPPYSLSKYPCQAVAWSKSTTVHGQDHDPHRVTFGDDMEIFYQSIDQMWTDWLKMPKEATCFWLHTGTHCMGFECERWVLGDATTNWDIKQIGGKR